MAGVSDPWLAQVRNKNRSRLPSCIRNNEQVNGMACENEAMTQRSKSTFYMRPGSMSSRKSVGRAEVDPGAWIAYKRTKHDTCAFAGRDSLGK